MIWSRALAELTHAATALLLRVKNKLDRRSSSAYKNGEIISGVQELGFIYLDFSCVEFSYEDFSKCS